MLYYNNNSIKNRRIMGKPKVTERKKVKKKSNANYKKIVKRFYH